MVSVRHACAVRVRGTDHTMRCGALEALSDAGPLVGPVLTHVDVSA
ncbi:hypothetical protein ACIRVF_30065 [Kitasatospora sp. NPDC101157]